MQFPDYVSYASGGLAVVTAVLAAIVTTLPPDPNGKGKWVWVALFIVLLVFSLVAMFLNQHYIYEEKRAADTRASQQDTELAVLRGKVEVLVQVQTAPKPPTGETERLQLVLQSLGRQLQTPQTPRMSLKLRCQQLSTEIKKYLIDENPSGSRTWEPGNVNETEEERRNRFMQETNASLARYQKFMDNYKVRFDTRVAVIRDQLAAAGITDRAFEVRSRRATNAFGIEDISTTLAVMAEKLPDE